MRRTRRIVRPQRTFSQGRTTGGRQGGHAPRWRPTSRRSECEAEGSGQLEWLGRRPSEPEGYRHRTLVDELKALWYQHQQVYDPPRPPAVSEPFAGLTKPDDAAVLASEYEEWHEVRWRWMIGPLADAAVTPRVPGQEAHVEDRAHDEDAAAFGNATGTGLEEAREAGELQP